jgi:transposase
MQPAMPGDPFFPAILRRSFRQPTMNPASVTHDAPSTDVSMDVIAQLRRGRPLGEVAREYNISVADLCRSIAETASTLEGVTFTAYGSEDDELRRLRIENEYLRKQRDFYRKAAGIVAVEMLPPDRTHS